MAQKLALDGTVTVSPAAAADGGQLDASILLKLKDNLDLVVTQHHVSRRTIDNADYEAINISPVTEGTFMAMVTDGGAIKIKINGGSQELVVDGLLVWQSSVAIESLSVKKSGTDDSDLELLIIE